MQAINKLILGTVQFGLNYGINNVCGKPEKAATFEMLSKAYSSGVTCLDTAEAYGEAHQIIGQFHKLFPGTIFRVMTKFPHHFNESVEKKIIRYLTELHVGQLEAVLFHSYQSFLENKANLDLLTKLKQMGSIKHIGVSVYTNEEAEDVMNYDEVDIIQLPFNLFDNINLRGDILRAAQLKGKIVHTRSAFLQGLFFKSSDSEHSAVNTLRHELNHIHELNSQYGISLQRMALSYCIAQKDINSVLIGVDNMRQLEQNLQDVLPELPLEVIDKINKIHILEKDYLNPSLWSH